MHNIKTHINQVLTIIFAGMILTSCQQQTIPITYSEQNLPEGMVYIPPGNFLMGGKTIQADTDEKPRHKVKVDAFLMDQTEVTNRQFKAFVDATGYITEAEKTVQLNDSIIPPGALVFSTSTAAAEQNSGWKYVEGANWKHPEGPGSSIEDKLDHPVVQVTYNDAQAYAKWAGKRLPTEAEWEWAAMGGLEDPIYPWGNTPANEATDKANFWQGTFPSNNTLEDGFMTTAPVKSFPANGYGLYEMGGNVWEWCADKYNALHYHALEDTLTENPKGAHHCYDPEDPDVEKYVIRGGSFLCNDSYCSGYRVARRMKSGKNTSLMHVGFRCVRDL